MNLDFLAPPPVMRKWCRGCSAAIRWEVTEAGKRIPIDWTPNPAGNIVILFERGTGYVAKVFKDAAAAEAAYPGEERWYPHHATCPRVKDFR